MKSLTKCDVQYDWKYRSNPDNYYHQSYQIACNRWTGIVIALMIAVFTVTQISFDAFVAFTSEIFVAVLIVLSVAILLLMIAHIFSDIIEWANS